MRYLSKIGAWISGIATVCLLATAPMAPSTALAQGPPPGDGLGDLFQPDFFRRDLTLISNSLNLDDTQKRIIETLFEDYANSIQDGIENLKNRWLADRAKFLSMSPEEITKLFFGAVEDWAHKKAQ